MDPILNTLTVAIHTGSVPIEVVVAVDPEIYEPVNRVTAWSMLSYLISKSSITKNRTAAGQEVIVNWGSVQAVTYENPWSEIEPTR